MAKALASFSITGAGDEYVLMIEDEDGDTTEFTASFDQLDLITEAIEEHLDKDEEEALGLDGDDDPDDDD